MAVRNAQIIIEKPSGTVPKNTDYDFPYQIIAPDYGDEIITRKAEVSESNLGSGKMYEIELHKPKFNTIEEVIDNSEGQKYLIKNGNEIWTVGDDGLVQLTGIENPTEEHFNNNGFTDNIMVGTTTNTFQMNYNGILGEGKVYSKKIPSYFVDLNSIEVWGVI